MSEQPAATYYGVTFDLSWFGLANMAVVVILVVYLAAEILRFVWRRRGGG